MKHEAYTTLQSLEGSWWHQGRIQAVESALNRYAALLMQNGKVLDIGAGYGGMYEFLNRYGPVDAVEPYLDGQDSCVSRGYSNVWSSLDSANSIDEYEIVSSFDVIEHIEDDVEFVRQAHKALKPGGFFLATVPAFQFLWSDHDRIHKHYRRYTRKTITALCESVGFEVMYCRYWNVTLFPIALLLRLLNKTGESSLSMNSVLNCILQSITCAEAKVLPYLPPLPGTGIVIIARRST